MIFIHKQKQGLNLQKNMNLLNPMYRDLFSWFFHL